MQPDLAIPQRSTGAWRGAALRLAFTWACIFAITIGDWRDMAHQWWNIDTYGHILFLPPIIAWLIWVRRGELAKAPVSGWWPGLVWMALGLSVWIGGNGANINLIAQAGAIMALQGAVLAILGLQVAAILAFPLVFLGFLVPFGDEIIPFLQTVTAVIATTLTHWSGVAMVADGIHIDTPAGLFIVAEECSGVKFLIAMVTLGVLVAHTCFTSWNRRAWLMLACILVPILANGVRAWATIFIAQYVGAEAAGSFDHIVYGWVFFGLVIALVLGAAWRWFERDPEDAGWTADEAADLPPVVRWQGLTMRDASVLAIALLIVLVFAALARVG